MAGDTSPLTFIVRRHWVGWLGYWLVSVPANVGLFVATWFLWWKGALSDRSGLAFLVIALIFMVKFIIVGYHRRAREVLVFTPTAVYEQTQRYLFKYNVTVYNLSERADHSAKTEWIYYLTLMDVRRVEVAFKSRKDNLVYEHAAGGESLEAGLAHIISLGQQS